MLFPSGHERAGRMPAVERESLIKLLQNNGFDRIACDKACSVPADKVELEQRFTEVKDSDSEIDSHSGKDNFNVRMRKKLKTRLEAEYMSLLGFAESCRDDADDRRLQTLADAATALVAKGPDAGKDRFYKGSKNWKEFQSDNLPGYFDAISAFESTLTFEEAVFKRANAILSPAPPPAVGLTVQQQQQLDAEQQGVNTQLAVWNDLARNAPGCNDEGTWGTSRGGSGPGFAATRLQPVVWRKLRRWWVRKQRAYVTLSDTTTWSLKMWRDVDGTNLSPTFNYHVDEG